MRSAIVHPRSTLHYSERLYRALLLLYPRRFRLRFSGEMAQMLRDCSQMAARNQGFAALLFLWLQTFEDLAVSIPVEWRREFVRDDSEIDFTGMADFFMITIVVGTLLLGWGWTGTVLALDLSAPAGILASTSFRTPVAIVLIATVTFALAVLIGILSAKFVARNGRTTNRGGI